MEDLNSRTPRELIDMVFVRLEIVEKEASEMAKSEKSAGKLYAIITQTEDIRSILMALRNKCQ